MGFQKGDENYSRIYGAPNKGLTKSDNPNLGNSGRKPGGTPWNKGKKTNIVTTGIFKKGHVSWNTGKKWSEEVRNKVSQSKKGQVAWNKNKPYLAIRGANHHNWKGGITPINKKIRESLEYKIWREAVFVRDNWTCVECQKHGGDLEADHIKPFSLFPELRFAIDNGRAFCKPCHTKLGWALFKENNPMKKELTTSAANDQSFDLDYIIQAV